MRSYHFLTIRPPRVHALIVSAIICMLVGVGAARASGPKPPKGPLLPGLTIIEWFPHRTVPVGGLARIDARVTNANKPQVGAPVTTTVKLGKRTLKVISGTKTGRNGQMEARFTVPSSWRGRVVRVYVAVRWKGQSITASDVLTIT